MLQVYVERNDVPHIYKEVNLTTHDNYKVIDLDYDTDSLVEINDNSDNSSLIGSSGHDTSSLVEINDNSDNSSLMGFSDNDTDSLSEVAVREEPIIPKRAVILAAGIPRGDGGGVPSGGDGGAVVPEEKDTSEEKTVPAIEAASPTADAILVPIVTTNPENIAIALLQKQKETIRVVTLAVNEIVILSYEFANSTIDLRLTNLRYLNNLTVLSSGDDVNIVPKNLWISGTIGKAKYNGKSMLNGYTGKISAVTIGEDIELPSGSIIGGAYNYVLSNFKYKNRINKIVVHTHVMSIYGQTNLSKKVILQGFLSLALGNVSTKLSAYNQLVKAKFADTAYSSKAIIAYNSRISRVSIVPYIGFKYGRYNIARYNASFETQSLLVAASNGRRTSGLIGFGVIMPMNVNNTSQMVPGLYMEVEKFLHNKQKNLHMQIESDRSNNREEVLLLEEAAKYQYKIGGTITIKCQLAEIMAAYEYLVFNNKYSHHQGSLKLKLLF
ncbi:autotransporter outer membrane beta-barrel domain-containing protein [Candidatus Tisiphia endosymbiont of Mystacides longicornis]|uniref:autotransporter outer membrane beta-barrel domain-containing protein n=1 Tax=Candidatus Tisiphia endosymbiont of Mystacides longicornis TaxID=3139330 RepID=UPI003CCAF98D